MFFRFIAPIVCILVYSRHTHLLMFSILKYRVSCKNKAKQIRAQYDFVNTYKIAMIQNNNMYMNVLWWYGYCQWLENVHFQIMILLLLRSNRLPMSTYFNATPTLEHGPINSAVWSTLCRFKSSIILYVFMCRAVNNIMLFRAVFNEHICNEWYIDIYVFRKQKSSTCKTSQSWLGDKWLAVSSDSHNRFGHATDFTLLAGWRYN